jgi:hypothetical protein
MRAVTVEEVRGEPVTGAAGLFDWFEQVARCAFFPSS